MMQRNRVDLMRFVGGFIAAVSLAAGLLVSSVFSLFFVAGAICFFSGQAVHWLRTRARA